MRLKAVLGAIAAVVVGVPLLAGGGVILWRSSLQAETARAMKITAANGVDVMEEIEIGGIRQVIRIRGDNKDNPVLLYLHGGPGTPMIPFSHAFQRPLESQFTVVQWDQRGAGKTAALSDPKAVEASMSPERMQADVIELTNHLRKRFGKEKIFLLGHSWGSILGIPTVQAHPELYYAYVGVGQVANVRESEKRGYERDLLQARKMGLKEAVEELEEIAPYPPAAKPWDGTNLDVRHKWNAYFGESIFGYQKLADAMAKIAWSSPDYGLGDFFRLLGDNEAYGKLDAFIYEYDARSFGQTFQTPVFMIMGRYDYQTNVDVAREYFDWLSAPKKAFFYVEHGAHAPMIEDPQRFAEILVKEVRPVAFVPAAPAPAPTSTATAQSR